MVSERKESERSPVHFTEAALALDHIDRFRPAGAAIGVDGRRVGEHPLDPVMQAFDVIDAGQDLDGGAGRYDRGEEGEIGAHIRRRRHPHADDPPVLIERQRRFGDMVPAHGVGEEGIRTLAGPLHRAAKGARHPGRHGVLRVNIGLHAETAADIGRDDADLFRRYLEHVLGQDLLQRPAALGAGIKRQRGAIGVEVGDGAPRLHGVDHHPVVDELDPRDVRGARERRLDGALVTEFPVEGKVVRDIVMELGHARIAGGPGVGDGVEGLVFDLDQLRRILGLGQGLGDHERHLVADETHLIGAKYGVLRCLVQLTVAAFELDIAGQRIGVLGLELGAGENGPDAGRGTGRIRRHRLYDCMGERRAHDDAGKLARQVDVVGEPAASRQQPRILDPAKGLTGAKLGHGFSSAEPK